MQRLTRAVGALVVSTLVAAGLGVATASPSSARGLDLCASSGGALSGTGAVGSPLSVDLPTWDLGVLSSSVEWLRGGTAFRSGASPYTPTESDAGRIIQVRQGVSLALPVIGTIDCSWVSNAVSVVGGGGSDPDPGDPGQDVLQLLGGLDLPATAGVGQLISLTDPVWSLPGVTTTYQWVRGGADIAGADGQSYVPTLDDAGSTIWAEVTGAVAGLPLVSVVSDTLDIPLAQGTQLSPTSDVVVSGSRKVGTPLTLSGPQWDEGGVTNKYQWLRDGAPIAGGNEASYELVAEDFGHSVSVKVTGHKDGFTDNTITSDPVEPVIGDAIQFVMKPRITGTGKVGKLLTADPGQWTGGTEGSGQPVYSYQWLRDGAAISGAVAQTYQVEKADIGKDLTVFVTATRPAYKAGKFTTAPVQVAKLASTLSATLLKKARPATKMRLVLKAPGAGTPTGKVKILDRGKVVKKATFTRGKHGRMVVKLRKLRPGKHKLRAVYAGSPTVAGATSKVLKLTVRKKK